MINVISILYVENVNCVLERLSQLPWRYKKASKVEKVVHNFQAPVLNYINKDQPSVFYTKKFHAKCHLGVSIRQYENKKKRDVGLYENRCVEVTEEY